jgi:hypothetical protein
VIFTTNAIESVNISLRKITKNRGSFLSDVALLKLFYLALNNISKKWTMPIRDWKEAQSVYYPIRGTDAVAVRKFHLHKIPDTLDSGRKNPLHCGSQMGIAALE